MLARAAGLRTGDREALRALVNILVLTGLGVAITGTSQHGSMGEHMISHYIDMFADPHPGSFHGEQVGVAALTMRATAGAIAVAGRRAADAASHRDRRARDARVASAGSPTSASPSCAPRPLDEAACRRVNAWLRRQLARELKAELGAIAIPAARLEAVLDAAGAPTTSAELGLDRAFWHEAVLHAREMRGRWCALDMAADAWLLDEFVRSEP